MQDGNEVKKLIIYYDEKKQSKIKNIKLVFKNNIIKEQTVNINNNQDKDMGKLDKNLTQEENLRINDSQEKNKEAK